MSVSSNFSLEDAIRLVEHDVYPLKIRRSGRNGTEHWRMDRLVTETEKAELLEALNSDEAAGLSGNKLEAFIEGVVPREREGSINLGPFLDEPDTVTYDPLNAKSLGSMLMQMRAKGVQQAGFCESCAVVAGNMMLRS